jgi:hypothetical protein
MKKLVYAATVLGCLLVVLLVPRLARTQARGEKSKQQNSGMFLLSSSIQVQAQDVVVGVNAWYRPPNLSQEDMAKQLAANGVKTIRTSLFPNTIDFVTEAYHQGIGSVVIVYPHTGSTAKKKQTWADVPLLELNPQEFTAAVKPMLDQLEAGGVRLTAFELGNEINTSGYNGDIAAPGSGRLLTVADLDNPRDLEAAVITAGFRNYAKIAAALKDLRDHSKLNQHTPIISAGIAKISGRGSKAEGWLSCGEPTRYD